VAREPDIEAIVEIGRRTRKPLPRGLWIAAAIVGVICATGFAITMLGDRGSATRAVAPASGGGSGTGIGLWAAAGAAIVIGAAVVRHRRTHSSRRRP